MNLITHQAMKSSTLMSCLSITFVSLLVGIWGCSEGNQQGIVRLYVRLSRPFASMWSNGTTSFQYGARKQFNS